MAKIDIEKLKKWYKFNFWTKEMILDAVEKCVISQEEAEEIIAVKSN